MRKIRFALALVLLLIMPVYCSAADILIDLNDREHNDPSALLFKTLLTRLDPESMTMVLDAEPASDGTVRHLYLDVKGAAFDGFRLESLRVETVFGKFNPVKEWKEGREIIVEDVMQGYVHAIAREMDMNQALLDMADEHWKDVKVDLRPGELFLKARYHVKGSVSLKILVEISTGLKIIGKQVWLDNYILEVNNAEKTSVIKDEIDKYQPLIDLEGFVFPLDLKEIIIDKEKIVFSSRVEPKSFDGIRYLYNPEN